MKQINLLPVRIRRQEQKRKLFLFALFGLGMGLGLVALVYIPVKLNVRSSEQRIEQIKATQVEREKQLAATQNSAKLDPDTLARITQLNTFSKSEIDWNKGFALVGSILPQEISLSGYTYGNAAGTVSLKINGTAPSNLSFAVFMQSLATSTAITKPKVDGYTFDPKGGKVTFSLTMGVPIANLYYSSPK